MLKRRGRETEGERVYATQVCVLPTMHCTEGRPANRIQTLIPAPFSGFFKMAAAIFGEERGALGLGLWLGVRVLIAERRLTV